MKISNEIKAGLVVIMAVGIGIFFFAETASFKHETYQLETSFVYAGDLKANAVVKLSGIEVGRVKDIKFVYEDNATSVLCVLELETWAKVREDSIAYIGTAGFVGDAFVGITPGTSENFADPGSTIASEDPLEMRVLMKKAEKIAENLDSLLTEVRTIVTDNRASVDNMVLNLEATTQNFKEFSEDVKRHPWKLLFRGE